MRRPISIALSIVAAVALLLAVALFALVDDWSRDLTTNFAATAADHDDPWLRPLVTQQSSKQVVAAVQQFAQQKPLWSFAGQQQGAEGTTMLRLVRTTGVLRFRDDITVTLQPSSRGLQIWAESRSRIGNGDFGQNPRNLRELMIALNAALADLPEAE